MIMNSSESYFPELENMKPVNTSKWGIMNVGLSDCDSVITGCQWKYTYFDGNKTRIISSYNLIKLREKVLNKGLEWIITENKYAIDAYKLNKELLEKHDELKMRSGPRKSYGNNSGVKNVYKQGDNRSRKGYYWVYLNKNNSFGQKTYSSTTLNGLKERIVSRGLEWIVFDEELYSKILDEEDMVL